MARAIKIKNCYRCFLPAPILYRVRYDESGLWFFVCLKCWESLSKNNPLYAYGGTWKARKKK
ncbi:MAG: hypothetical protein EAZ78_10355 [Oscillatoriales cyanobacterium]|nr:MAG: hypothetical protein EA000_15900 [Oscillatoriales cyanobacterium]TAD95818.1 MAG: hypothetical protein EAZ98_14350 [Oscillatoriales cyanobacterium]TAE03455.1 MAG: hypothetical protein EAZ96_12750 [Oscillatoriales cyanobacterium]TAF04082.1 MAG: hypothetical protein EAZ78_10355 [Oscillatoriales cyanobacterium]TAF43165.1 MAG: hypothetical protein EAZ68_08605 [Oscillatoriales cyanobacterium]